MLEAARFVPEHLRQLDGVSDLLEQIQTLQGQVQALSAKAWHRFPALGESAYRLSGASIQTAIDSGATTIRVDFPADATPYVPGTDSLFVDLGGIANQDPEDAYLEDPSGRAIHLLIFDSDGDVQLYEGQKVRVRWFA